MTNAADGGQPDPAGVATAPPPGLPAAPADPRAARGMEPNRLRALLRGELDWIVRRVLVNPGSGAGA